MSRVMRVGCSRVIWSQPAVLWPFSLCSGQVEDTEEFGPGVVQEKRINKLLEESIWDWCGIATCFAIIAAVVLVVLVVLDADITEAWTRSAVFVLGILGALTVLHLG